MQEHSTYEHITKLFSHSFFLPNQMHLKPIWSRYRCKKSTKFPRKVHKLLPICWRHLLAQKQVAKWWKLLKKKIPQLLFNLLQVKNLSQYFYQLSRSDWSANGQTFLIILVQHVSDLLLAEKGTKSGHKKKVKCNSERRDFYDKTLIPQDWNYLTRKCMQQEMKL